MGTYLLVLSVVSVVIATFQFRSYYASFRK